MKPILAIATFILLGLTAQANAAGGCEETLRWWSQIEASGRRVDAELRSLYREAASQASKDPLIKRVDRLIRERYPGGSFAEVHTGRLVFNANNFAEFVGQETRFLMAKVGEVRREYNLKNRRFTLSRGGHFVTGEIATAGTAHCRFIEPISLPKWVEEEAAANLGSRGGTFHSDFIEVLNRVYERRLEPAGIRMDQVAEQILTDDDMVKRILAMDREIEAPKSP